MPGVFPAHVRSLPSFALACRIAVRLIAAALRARGILTQRVAVVGEQQRIGAAERLSDVARRAGAVAAVFFEGDDAAAPIPPDWNIPAEFVVGRLMYPGGRMGFRGGADWTHGGTSWTDDYPKGDRTFIGMLRRFTRTHVRGGSRRRWRSSA